MSILYHQRPAVSAWHKEGTQQSVEKGGSEARLGKPWPHELTGEEMAPSAQSENKSLLPPLVRFPLGDNDPAHMVTLPPKVSPAPCCQA